MHTIDQLDDGRAVYLNGERIQVSQVPIFRKTLALNNQYYALQKSHPAVHTYTENGHTYDIAFKVPRTVDDLRQKHQAYQEIAETNNGMLGRTPDFLNTGMAILAEKSAFLGHNQYTNFAENAKNYAKWIKENDIFISHALQNPQLDRSQPINGIPKGYAGVHTIERRADGIVVSGAKMVNTMAPIADDLLVFNPPELLLEKGDTSYGVAFATPLNTPGVKVICRKLLDHPGYTEDDYPLSNLLDEIDAYIVFDHAFIPWDKVFVENDYDMSNRFFIESGMFIHTSHQDEARGITKLEFATTVAIRVAKLLGLDHFLGVQEKLGRLTANLELIKGTIARSEDTGHLDEQGIYTPNLQALTAVRANLPAFYEDAMRVTQHLAAGSMVGVPGFEEFAGDNGDILQQALTTNLATAEERSKLLNLAFDLSSSGFGQRQLMYEYYHGGDPMRIRSKHYLDEDLHAGNAMLDRLLRD
ncbi:4-hydroxyphenylacetate 3-hydroxylase N-terminal domain-containing protein [Lactiplantibacillus fabifermentans]|uniref:4-hydroxyphenylacetate-3-hydroxylase n=1 Tax=Lactiplantibacillus fabifermentans DSM 21115 TaxID=1413187 RepID=A0A0R2NUH3_9LACO|nr:4-hydroxyphenylacetate 3-hydroxylase N-terminal domain-containing protein [Lactiplantibacillus fabifermentans]KRO28972.1 4-hydroxyphenylacetate-3-hydroxylase [Lactiplantibacillus fabifermentans DSM 21115]